LAGPAKLDECVAPEDILSRYKWRWHEIIAEFNRANEDSERKGEGVSAGNAHEDFRQDLLRAREIRADFSFGEQIIDIADDSRNDWVETKTGRMVPDKELVLRSKLRIAARQLHMSRLQPQTWGDRPEDPNPRKPGGLGQ
jgi:hypothetical protein